MKLRIYLIGAMITAAALGPASAMAGTCIDNCNRPVSGVPEPATWGLMLVGVGVIGAAIRMARRKAVLSQTA